MRRHIACLAAVCLAAPVANAQTAQQIPAPFQALPAAHAQTNAQGVDVSLQQKLQLLQQRIAERDRLQQEIDRLLLETQTPETIAVSVEFIELNWTAAEKLGVKLVDQQSLTGAQLGQLRKQGAARTIFRPKFMAPSGQVVHSRLGHEGAENSAADASEISVRVDALGGNRVNVDLHARHVGVPTENQSQPTGISVDTHYQSTLGDTNLFRGALVTSERTRRAALGRVTETVKLEQLVLVRTEAVMPQTGAIIPATAISPR